AVRIPMRGAIGSLNASVAGSILLFAAVAQRDPAGLGDKPARPVGGEEWPVRNEPAAEGGPAEKKTRSRGQSVVAPDPEEAPAEVLAAPAEAPAPPKKARAPRKTATSEPAAAKARPT